MNDLVGSITLPDALPLRVRPLHNSDAGLLSELYARLTPNTRYLRFFSMMPQLPDSVLDALLNVDCRRRVALVAECDGTVVGLGSFGAIDDESAEVALVVCDEWQRRRLGTALAMRVLAAAERRGFHRFVAHVLSTNDAARRLVRSVGTVLSWRMHGGVTELVFVRRDVSLTVPSGPPRAAAGA